MTRAFCAAACVFRHALAFILLDLPRALLQRSGLAPAAGTRLAAMLETLGPTAIKLGQILGSRPDLLPPALTVPLSRLHDCLYPFPGPLAVQIAEESLGLPINEVFSSFELRPVAAASIAQVHRARLLDGREVAVKVRRPGVEKTIERDLRFLQLTARALARLPGMRLMPIAELVEEIMVPILEQVDFELEAENNRTLRRNFRWAERLTIPFLVEELCRPNLLVMEYCADLRSIGERKLAPDHGRTVALTGLRALYRMIFVDGFVHADMHPGNFRVRGESEVVLLDTGLVVRLDKATQADFVDFFFALVNNEGEECARIIEDNAQWLSPHFSRERFRCEMAALIARHSMLKSKDFEIATFVYELMETQRRAGVRGSTAFMMTVLSMVVYDGICKQLYADCEFQQEARPFLIVGRYGRRKLAMSC
jgi:ubiquinone biosynthesis protein